jgi:TRAP-type C4-dicarboxylate transport system permease small subunit
LLRHFRSFTQALNIAGTVLILIMAVAVNADIGGRDFFNHPIPGVNEFIGLSIVAVVFLQMANTLQEGRHVSNDIIIRLFADSHPRLSAGLYACFDVVGALLMAIIVIYVWPIMVEHYQGRYYAGTAGVIEIPTWPFMAVVVIGAAATTVQFLVDAWRMTLRAAGRETADA